MFCCLNLILTLAYLKYVLVAPDRKFVYQKDMSEYCRRRVMPSVFLGRHVVEANSQILHFAKLELPYSCFISVRSESGNNVILVIQMVSDENLLNSCTETNNQLLVYEMGETFGGYWGPLPDSLMQQERVNTTKYYTLKTTPMTTTDTLSPIEDVNKDNEEESNFTLQRDTEILKDRQDPSDSDDFISVELPIVNVSAILVPGVQPPRSAFEIDDAFEFIYDVAPRRGTQYDTSILPLVQFSVKEQSDYRRFGETAKDLPQYQLDYNIDSFTPDMRLTYEFKNPTTYKKIKLFPKQKYNANRRINFRKNRTFFVTSHTQSHQKRYQSYHPTMRQNTAINNSWLLIDNLMKTLSKTNVLEDVGNNESKFSYILQKISNLKHNYSAYLAPNLSIYDISTSSTSLNVSTLSVKETATITYSPYHFLDSPEDGLISNNHTALLVNKIIITEDVTKPTLSTFLMKLYNSSTVTLKTKDNSLINNFFNEDNIATAATAKDNYSNINMSTTQFEAQASTNSLNEELLTGSLVDHESWENLVQVAPVMAVVLNQTVKTETTISDNSDLQKARMTNGSKINRKKRYIHSIPIQLARPHFLAPKKEKTTTSGVMYNVGEMHEFAQLVELQDDEMHGRVALRYLRHFVGPAQFNICNYNGATTHRNVFMFNSSRIVIAISNFTLDRMAVVLTPARSLVTADARCSKAHLECQVSGVRVCIDSNTACDGIPNCGSYDIYDEDRLRCGAAAGLQHNVYLAAITLMAVVLTVLYTVHYWLKRCVPNVFDAFFIYTNGAENELYLNTVMRSPNEDDDSLKYMYHGDIFKGVVSDANIYNKMGEGAIGRFLKRFLLCQCFRRKHQQKDLHEIISDSDFYNSFAARKKMYSFTELEIRKMTGQQLTNTAVQTGESLEMKCIKNKKNEIEPKCETSQITDTLESEIALDTLSMLTLNGPHREKYVDELSIMKFLKDSKSHSVRSSSLEEPYKTKINIKSSITADEKEIHNHNYGIHNISESTSGTSMITSYEYLERPGPSGLVKKHLRFEKETTLIPSAEQEEESKAGANNERRSVVLGVAKLRRNVELGTIAEGDEQNSNTTRDYRRFWGLSKKSKK